MSNYQHLLTNLDLLLNNVGNVSGIKLLYNAIKQDSEQKRELEQMESSFSHLVDPLYQTKTLFNQWLLQSDIYLKNSNFKKDIFLTRFLKQREKIEFELNKTKPNTTILNSLLTNLRMNLHALEQNGEHVNSLSVNNKELNNNLNSNIVILEQGKPYDVLSIISKIFSKSKKYIKVMDRWVSSKTFEYYATAPDIPIMTLTTQIDTTLELQIMLKRLNEERENKIQIRRCNKQDFHDRYIITDEELWSVGPSLKDAGYKTWGTITRAEDNEKKDEINQKFDEIWEKSRKFEDPN